MLEKLHPLFRRGRNQQLPDVLPCFKEGAGIVADPLDRSLLLGEVHQLRLDSPLLFFEPLQFRLDTCQPPRSQVFQNFDQLAGLGMDLGQPAAGEFFLFPEPYRLATEAGKGFLHDAVPRLDHSPDFRDSSSNGILQCLRRNAGGLAGVLAALVLLAGADVVVVHVGATVGRRPDHVRPALAAKQAGERVDPALRFLEVHVPLEHLADLKLHAVELLPGDDRLVAFLFYRIAPVNPAKVNRVAKDADDLLLDEAVAAPRLVRAGAVGRIADAEVIEPPCHRTGGAEFLERVEDTPDDVRRFGVDLQLAPVVRLRAVAEDMPAIPQAPVGPVPHDGKRPLGGHLPLKLGEDHDELHHRFAGRHRRVELLPQGNDIHVVLCEQRPKVHEVFKASGDPVELEADDEVDLACGDVALEPLELRPVLVLGALAGIDVELQRLDLQVLPPLAKLDLLLDLVLLGNEAVAFGRLTLRGDADVSGDPQGFVFLLRFRGTHGITALFARHEMTEPRIGIFYEPTLIAPGWFARAGQEWRRSGVCG